jgi:hypothetical protein
MEHATLWRMDAIEEDAISPYGSGEAATRECPMKEPL